MELVTRFVSSYCVTQLCNSGIIDPHIQYSTQEQIKRKIFIARFFKGAGNAKLGLRNSEAVDWRCFVKKVFLEIWQNSQENTCARVSF